MATTVTMFGLTFSSDDFAEYGFRTPVTVSGTAYPLWQALFVAGMLEIDQRASAGAGGAATVRLTFDAATADAAPAAGGLRIDNATQSSGLTLFVSTTDAGSADITAFLDSLDDSTNSPVKGHIRIGHRTDPTKWLLFTISAVTTATGYRKLTVANMGASSSSPFTAADPLALSFSRAGNVGQVGGGVSLTFSTTTTDADPGNGTLRLSSATQNAATQAFVDLLDANGATITTWLDSLDDSTSTMKGVLVLQHQSDPTKYLHFQLASVTTATGYRKLGLTCILSSASSPFSNGDAISAAFLRTGDLGQTGVDGTNKISEGGTAGGTANALTCTASPVPTLTRGQAVVLLTGAAASTAGTVTFNPNSLGAANISVGGSTTLADGALPANTNVLLVYDGTNWKLVAGASSGASAPDFLLLTAGIR